MVEALFEQGSTRNQVLNIEVNTVVLFQWFRTRIKENNLHSGAAYRDPLNKFGLFKKTQINSDFEPKLGLKTWEDKVFTAYGYQGNTSACNAIVMITIRDRPCFFINSM